MQGQVNDEAQRPLPLGRLHYPPAKQSIEPFQAGIVLPFNLRAPEEKGNFLEAVTVLAVSDDTERVFVKFYRDGNTAWVETDRLTDH